MPAIEPGQLVPGRSGVRAQAMYRDGRLLENIEFVRGPGILQVVNALSPVATASLAMGERIAGMTLHRA